MLMQPHIMEYFTPQLKELRDKDPSVYINIEQLLEKSLITTLAHNKVKQIKPNKSIIEEKIRLDLIKTTLSTQQQLENKLKAINLQLESLKEVTKTSKTSKIPSKTSLYKEEPIDYQALLNKFNEKKNKILVKKSKIEKKMALEQEEALEEHERIELKLKNDKKQEIKARIENFKENQKAKKLDLEKKELNYKKNLPKEVLYKKMRNNFNRIKTEELQERLQSLIELKKAHARKPLTELEDFEDKINAIMDEKNRIRAEKLQKWKEEVIEREAMIKQKFNIAGIIRKMEDLRKEELRRSMEKHLITMNKGVKHKEFFEKVKKEHKPKIDKSKALELELIKEKIKENKRISKYYMSEPDLERNEEEKDGYKLGVEYLRQLKDLKYIKRSKKNKINSNNVTDSSLITNIEHINLQNTLENLDNELNINQINLPKHNLELENYEETLTKQHIFKDPRFYLKEISSKYHLNKKPDYWKKIDKNPLLSNFEKLEKLRQEAYLMEEKAKRKEQVLKLQRQHPEYQMEKETEHEDIDDLLMNSIQAKLRLLEN